MSPRSPLRHHDPVTVFLDALCCVAGIDDEDGGPLIQREDDRPETIGRRLDLFESETMPLVDYDAKSNRLATVDATQSMDAVTHELRKAIGLDGGRAA